MLLRHTEGNRKRWTVDYCSWLLPGETIDTQTVTSSSTTFTVDTTSILLGTEVVFFANDGVAGETPTVTITITTSKGETKIDTLEFVVTAP